MHRYTRRKQRGAGGAGSKPANAPAQAEPPKNGTRANRNAARAARSASQAAERAARTASRAAEREAAKAVRQSARELRDAQREAAKAKYEADKAIFIEETRKKYIASGLPQAQVEQLTRADLIEWALAHPVSSYIAELEAEASEALEEMNMPNIMKNI